MRSTHSTALIGALAVLMVCVAVYWIGLGSGGIHSTEGHRVIPAYEMLDHGASINDWLVPRMFEQPYLRKPPGMPWAIALSSELLGRTVFAARAVSACAMTLMALAAFWFGRRWFGPVGGIASGVAQALIPVLWESGRAAEIEALNNLATQIGVLALVHAVFVGSGYSREREGVVISNRTAIWFSILSGIGIMGAALAKGPASVPVFIGAFAAVCIAGRSIKLIARQGLVAALIGLVGSAGLLAIIAWASNQESLEPVTQSPSAFMFEPGQLIAIAILPVSAFVQFLPASLSLLFPWGRDAASELGRGLDPRAWTAGRTLAIAFALSIALFMIFGVRNPRYTLPAAGLLGPLAGMVISGLGCWLTPKRDRIARAMLLGKRWVWLVLLIPAAWVYIATAEANRRSSSGSEIGHQVAKAIEAWAGERGYEGRIVVLADHLIEARPEVLLALEERIGEPVQASEISVRWVPGLSHGGSWEQPHSTVILALRTDGAPSELQAMESALGRSLQPLSVAPEAGWLVHKYMFSLYLLEYGP